MAPFDTAVIYSVKKRKEKSLQHVFSCQGVVGWSFMTFEAGDIVIYSFYYQAFAPLAPKGPHMDRLTYPQITVEACSSQDGSGTGTLVFSKVYSGPPVGHCDLCVAENRRNHRICEYGQDKLVTAG